MSAARDTLHLWGAPAAGKTGVLGALYATSKSQEADRWEAHPKDCRDPYTQEQLFDAYEQLHDRAVAKTDVRKDGYRPLDFLLRQFRRGAATGATMRLSLVDPAGEYSTRTELGHTEHGRSLFARVAHGGGLLWLFSAAPDGAPASLDRLVVLRHLVALLEQAGSAQLSLPVGLCLSKIDALTPAQRDAALADPRAALLAHLGPTTFTWFEAACPQLRCFAISSAGTEAGRVRPVGLLPMLSWFAEAIGAAPADAAPNGFPDVMPDAAPDGAPAEAATVEVPSVRPARRGLAALAARLASAGAVPAGVAAFVRANGRGSHGDDPADAVPSGALDDGAPISIADAPPTHGDEMAADVATTMAMPAVPRPAAFGAWDAPRGASPEPGFARPLTPGVPAAAVMPPPFAPLAPMADTRAADGAPSLDPEPSDDAALPGSWRDRAVRATASAGLVLAALGAGALAGRAAILAAADLWTPPGATDARAAAGPGRARGLTDPDYRALLRDLETEAARDRDRDRDRDAITRQDSIAAAAGEIAPDGDELVDDATALPIDDGELRFDTIQVPTPPPVRR